MSGSLIATTTVPGKIPGVSAPRRRHGITSLSASTCQVGRLPRALRDALHRRGWREHERPAAVVTDGWWADGWVDGRSGRLCRRAGLDGVAWLGGRLHGRFWRDGRRRGLGRHDRGLYGRLRLRRRLYRALHHRRWCHGRRRSNRRRNHHRRLHRQREVRLPKVHQPLTLTRTERAHGRAASHQKNRHEGGEDYDSHEVSYLPDRGTFFC